MSAHTTELRSTTTRACRREKEYLDTCSAFSDVFVREQRADGCATVISWVRERLANTEVPESTAIPDTLTQQAKWATWRLATSSPFDDVRAAFSEFAKSSVDRRCTICSTFYRTPPDPVASATLVLGRRTNEEVVVESKQAAKERSTSILPTESTSKQLHEQLQHDVEQNDRDKVPNHQDENDKEKENGKKKTTQVAAAQPSLPSLPSLPLPPSTPTPLTPPSLPTQPTQPTQPIPPPQTKSGLADAELLVEDDGAEAEEEDPTILFVRECGVWQYVNSCKLGYPGASWSKLDVIFGMHPTYLESELESHRCLMLEEGPLPPTWRNYIAIMAASRYNCHYLVFQQRRRFLHNGGDPEWLEGITKVPTKLARLINLNALLAHRPWLLSGAEGEEDEVSLLLSGTHAFSSAELAHAVVLLATYHAQASFCHAMGCLLEPEDEAMSMSEMKVSDDIEEEEDRGSVEEVSSATGTGVGTGMELDDKEIFSRLKKQHSSLEGDDPDEDCSEDEDEDEDDDDENDEDQQPNKEIKLEEFRQIDDMETLPYEAEATPGSPNMITRQLGRSQQSLHLQTNNTLGSSTSSSSMSSLNQRLSCHVYCGDNALEYKDFDISKDQTIFTQEYSWGEQCFALTSHYLPKTGERLDQQFNITYDMTYETFSDSVNVDTLPFRRAIWYYVLRLYGICHDDYEYKEVNIYLNRSIKAFVKKSVCYPELITRSDFVHFSPLLQASEKCHIGVLILESRKQAEIIYGLRSLENSSRKK